MHSFWIILAIATLAATAAQAGHFHGASHGDAANGCPPGMHSGGCSSEGFDSNQSSDTSGNGNSWKPSSFNYSLTDDETKPIKKKYDYDSIPAFPPGSPGAADKVWKENGAPVAPNSGSGPHDSP